MSTYRADGTPDDCQNCIFLEKKLEDTRKPRLSGDDIFWIVFVIAAAAVIITIAICIYKYNLQSLAVPKEAESCQDSAVILTSADSTHQCQKGATLSMESLPNNQALMRCLCTSSVKNK